MAGSITARKLQHSLPVSACLCCRAFRPSLPIYSRKWDIPVRRARSHPIAHSIRSVHGWMRAWRVARDIYEPYLSCCGWGGLRCRHGRSGLGKPGTSQAEDLEARLRAQDERIGSSRRRFKAFGTRRAVASLGQDTAAVAAGAPAEEQVAAGSDEGGSEPTIKLRVGPARCVLGSGEGMTSGAQVRRFYLGVEGELGGGFSYLAHADFAGNEVNLQDAFIGHEIDSTTELLIGYFKPSNTNDEVTSDVHTLFLERSAYAGIFAPGRRIGVGVNHSRAKTGACYRPLGEREAARSTIADRKVAGQRAVACRSASPATTFSCLTFRVL